MIQDPTLKTILFLKERLETAEREKEMLLHKQYADDMVDKELKGLNILINEIQYQIIQINRD